MPTVFDHVAIATNKITDAPDFLVGELGGISGYGGPSGDFTWWHWDFEGGGRIEIIEPDGPPGGFVHRYLERLGAGIHHVNFEVDSLKETVTQAEQLGYSVVGYDDSHEYWKEAFLHPKTAMGIVVQLVEASHHDHDHEEWDHSDMAAPTEPADPPAAVTIVGLEMRTSNGEAAMRQWGELLKGDCTETPEGLRFRWPGSSMRVTVAIEEGVADEAVAIEVSAGRSLSLPSGEHPELGTRFVQVES